MKKCRIMIMSLVAAMVVLPLMVNADCGSCNASAKKESEKSCCSADKECNKEKCSKEACKADCKCKKNAESDKSCGCSSKCKKSK